MNSELRIQNSDQETPLNMDSNRNVNRAELGQSSAALPEKITDARSCMRNWKRWIRPVFYVVYALVVITGIPFIILDIINAAEDKFKITLAGVGFFAMIITIPISAWGIINHIVCFTRPSLQMYIIRILWMVPIYELNSWFALRFPAAEIYLDTFRQLYKAYVIYNFVFYLLAFFEEVPNFENRLIMKPQIKSPHPFCCIKAVPNQRIIGRCKTGVLNYTVIRILFTIIIIITQLTGTYKEGNLSIHHAYLWVTIIVTVSQTWAMYCMALLRKATKDELKMLPRSTSQFMSIHLVIFVTNFQGTILGILASSGAMKPKDAWGFKDEFAFATMLQDLLVCLEMVVCAILFSYSFDYQRYDTENELKISFAHSFKHIRTISDVRSNFKIHLKRKGHSSRTQQRTDLVRTEQPTAVEDLPSPSSTRQEGVSAPPQVVTLPDITFHQDVDGNQDGDVESDSSPVS